MQRTSKTYTINHITAFKKKLLQWAQQANEIIWLDNNKYTQKHSAFEAVLAIHAQTKLECNYKNAFKKLKKYQTKTKDYIFGYLGYDLKNDLEKLSSTNFDGLQFPDLFFFQPKKIFFIKKNTIEIKYIYPLRNEIETDFNAIKNTLVNNKKQKNKNVKIKSRISKKEYFTKLNTILKHIYRGDIYEANFCQEFYGKNSEIYPLNTYQNLNAISKPPFATFFKNKTHFLLSASPERYIQKTANTVISQPIKGTEKRADSIKKDLQLIYNLEKNEKERAENIMIVDLVRNDLSRIAKKGTVNVSELCKVYTFKQVHQLISTITCKVSKKTHPVKIIKSTFPMGSMTGAPKISAMQIIEQVEETKRGLYSGAVGYFTPKNNFDFNVIIRSILYNSQSKYVSFSVGGAITAKSTPKKEYEECLLKAKAMKQVLTHK